MHLYFICYILYIICIYSLKYALYTYVICTYFINDSSYFAIRNTSKTRKKALQIVKNVFIHMCYHTILNIVRAAAPKIK